MVERREGNQEDLPTRLMTEETYNILLKRKEEICEELKHLGSKRRGIQQRAMMHDDAGTAHFENALRAELEMIGNLSSVRLIKPPESVSFVSIGVEVEIEYNDGRRMTGFLLGPDDAIWLKDKTVISYKSPLGSKIIGKSIGEEVEIKIKHELLRVKILNISKGNF